MEYTKLQNEVIEKAREEISSEPWFKGICTDNIPSDEEILRGGIEESVNALIWETEIWDNPLFFSPEGLTND